MKLKELPIVFTRLGVKYTQIDKQAKLEKEDNGDYKTDGYVIYKCSALNYNDIYYEVFKYKITKPHPLSNEDYDFVESYPGNEMFGNIAWCCNTKESVKNIMKEHFNIDYQFKDE